jgi:hypothetical protein
MVMKISVAMCTYNGGQYIQQQLDSLARQTRLPFELVICDDRSTDATEDIVRRFSVKVPFSIRFMRNQTSLGSTANFAQAISLCSGDLIALCDQDDIWSPQKLEKQAARFEQDATIGGVFCDGDLIDFESAPLHISLWQSQDFTRAMRKEVSEGFGAAAMMRQNFVTGTTLMFRSSLRQDILPVPDEWVHDAWIAWMISMHSRLCLVPERLIYYRIHAAQQIGADLQPLRTRVKRDPEKVIQQHKLELLRMASLEGRIRKMSVEYAMSYLDLVQGKKAFLKTRIGLLQRGFCLRLIRLSMNIRGYMRFAKGARSILGDLLL